MTERSMKAAPWTPADGWRPGRATTVKECPVYGSESEFSRCGVEGCMNTDFAEGFPDEPRYHSICSKHSLEKLEYERQK